MEHFSREMDYQRRRMEYLKVLRDSSPRQMEYLAGLREYLAGLREYLIGLREYLPDLHGRTRTNTDTDRMGIT